MILEFYKYQGTGNDFIIIDDRKELFNVHDSQLIASLCERRMGIGADGLILLRDHDKYDFEMIYFNSDGHKSSMCGNGGRCIVAFAHLLEIIDNEAAFLAIDGEHRAKLLDVVALRMQDVNNIEKVGNGFVIDTGSPHYVEIVDELENMDVVLEGRKIRNSKTFKKQGVNVNFVQDSDQLEVRTYERGVEEETLSCGTGVVAAAIVMHFSRCTDSSVIEVKTKGGVLNVDFEEFKGSYRNIWLMGDACMVYAGEFEC